MKHKEGESTIYLLYKGKDVDDLPALLRDLILARKGEVLKQIEDIKKNQSKVVFTFMRAEEENKLTKPVFETFFVFNEKKQSIVGFLDKITDKKHTLKQGLSIEYKILDEEYVLLIITILNHFDTNTEFYDQNSFNTIIDLFKTHRFHELPEKEANSLMQLVEKAVERKSKKEGKDKKPQQLPDDEVAKRKKKYRHKGKKKSPEKKKE